MATLKAAPSKNTLKGIIAYVTRTEKTEEKLLSGIDCNPESALDEMEITKLMWDKIGGRQYKHFVQSFHKDEKITPEEAHEIAVELAQNTPRWRGFEVLIATHIDKEHIHTHFIINSVNYENGYKLQWKKHDLEDLKQRNDELCIRNGLSVPEKGKTFEGNDRTAVTAYNSDTYEVLKNAEQGKSRSYIEEIYSCIKEELKVAPNKEVFIYDMKTVHGIDVNWSETRKHITFTDIDRQEHGEKKCKIRNNKLQEHFGDDFSKENLERIFRENEKQQKKAMNDLYYGRYRETRENTWTVFSDAQRLIFERLRDSYDKKKRLYEDNSYIFYNENGEPERKMLTRDELESNGYFEQRDELNEDISSEKAKLSTLREYQELAKGHQAIVQSLIDAGADDQTITEALNNYDKAMNDLKYYTEIMDEGDFENRRLKVAKFSYEQAKAKADRHIAKLEAPEVSPVMAAVEADYQNFAQEERVLDTPEPPIPEKQRDINDMIQGAAARSGRPKQKSMASWDEYAAEMGRLKAEKRKNQSNQQEKKKNGWERG